MSYGGYTAHSTRRIRIRGPSLVPQKIKLPRSPSFLSSTVDKASLIIVKIIMKISKEKFAMFLLLVALGGCEKAVINSIVLSHLNHHELQSCTAGFTFNARAKCNGCKFTTKDALKTAIQEYYNDKITSITTYGEMRCWDVSSITDMSNLF